MRNTIIRGYLGAGLVLALLLAGCGPNEPERSSAAPTPPTNFRENVVRCVDAPRVPEVNPQVYLERTDKTVAIGWAGRGWPGFTVRLDDPTCRDRGDLQQWLKPRGPFPRFENASIVVRPGGDCAYVAYTLYGGGQDLFGPLESITAVRPDGRQIDWKHQTATGGPSEISDVAGRQMVEAATDGDDCNEPGGGDVDFFDASDVRVGETVRVTFRFFEIDGYDRDAPPEPAKVVEVPFRVVSGSPPVD